MTPSSSSAAMVSRSENTWKPPESVRIGPLHPEKAWRPPSSSTRCSPGRKCRWYAFARTTSAPSARTSSGCRDLTVPFVPTGMNAGVRISPCPVVTTPARAAPSVATMRKLSVSSLREFATRPRGHPAPPPAMSVSPNLERMGHASATKQRRIVHGRGANLMSQHQHRVAERVEAVPLRNRLPVELAHDLDPGERHHQREQGRPRQMEVRQ